MILFNVFFLIFENMFSGKQNMFCFRVNIEFKFQFVLGNVSDYLSEYQ